MREIIERIQVILILLMLISTSLNAQRQYKLSAITKLQVSGTSTLHDWTMVSNEARASSVIVADGNTLEAIENLEMTMKSESLKSGKAGMDSNAYKALKSDKYPNISFKLLDVQSLDKKEDCYQIAAICNMTIANTTTRMTMDVQAYPAQHTMRFVGSHSFKLTDFEIEPPTALLGTVKTGDLVTIHFDLTFKAE